MTEHNLPYICVIITLLIVFPLLGCYCMYDLSSAFLHYIIGKFLSSTSPLPKILALR